MITLKTPNWTCGVFIMNGMSCRMGGRTIELSLHHVDLRNYNPYDHNLAVL